MLDLLTPDERLELTVGDYVRLLMAEAIYALCIDNTESCILTLENILRLNRELLSSALATLAHLWKARAHRKKADYVYAPNISKPRTSSPVACPMLRRSPPSSRSSKAGPCSSEATPLVRCKCCGVLKTCSSILIIDRIGQH